MQTTVEELNNIIKGCRERKSSSQQQLYRSFYNYAMKVLGRYVFAEDEKADVLNDSFFKALTKIDQYGGDLPFKAWFRKIVVNTAIDHIRAKKRLPQFDEISEINTQEQSIESDVLVRLSQQQILALVAKLPNAYRTVFNLYVVDEYTHAEISDLLGISVGTSKSNLARARQILKMIMENE